MTTKAISILFCLAFAAGASAQDTAWRKLVLTPDATAWFPSPDTATQIIKDYRFHTAMLDSNYYMALYDTQAVNMDIARRLDIVYKGFLDGLANGQFKDYHRTVADTNLGGTSGKFIRSVAPPGQYMYAYISQYVTVANGHIYQFSNYFRKPPGRNDLDNEIRFFSGISFGAVRENHLPSSSEAQAYSLGYKIGTYGGYLFICVLLAGIGYLCYWLIKRNRKA